MWNQLNKYNSGKKMTTAEQRLAMRKAAKPGWSPASLLAERAIKRHNITHTITAAEVCQAANIVGENRWRAISYTNGRLKIIAPDYEAVAKIKQTEPILIQQINHELRQPLVTQIICQLHWGGESDNLQP